MKQKAPQTQNKTYLTPVNCIPAVALNAINHILKSEGGYVNDANDHGGATNFGISDLRDGKADGLIDINLDGIGDIDPNNLTRDQAIGIYYKDYWLKNQCDKMPASVALVVFDIAVNQGAAFARKNLQNIVGAKADGIIGKKTLAKLQQTPPRAVIHQLTKRRCSRYAKNVRNSADHNQVKYLAGWLNRAFDVLETANTLVFAGYNHHAD